MARRRKKNPLLTRIIVISVAVHVVALPILAKFGAFKKIKHEYLETQMVKLPPPPAEKEKPQEKKQTKVAHKAVAAKTASAASHGAAHHSNLNTPHVAIAAGGSGDDSGPTVEQGSGKEGVVPTATKQTAAASATTQPTTAATPTSQPTAPEKVVKNTEPVKAPVEPEKPAAPVTPHVPVVVEAEPTDSPQPSIPDDLRSAAIDKTCVTEVTVSAAGMPVSVTIAQSSGNSELDGIAVDTAKHWRFKPATSDGMPVQSTVRLHIEFQVS